MPSLITGYEYDIFISYRQKDNKYDGWVTEFVANLRKELEATFKEDISIFFDQNAQDGLLETYDVNKSLQGKLKSLIFIPVISQTYCDPKSYAWQYEFLAFRDLVTSDPYGLNIKLHNGNVASRILPVKIHELDTEDKTLLKNELGTVLRSIGFIYNSSGVNRPLTPSDNPDRNFNRTFYRDQINKVANSVKEIITALIRLDGSSGARSEDRLVQKGSDYAGSVLKKKPVIFYLSCLVLIIGAYYALGVFQLYPGGGTGSIDKSIAVLPFVDMSPGRDHEYFGDGIADQIIYSLIGVRDLKVIARTSSFQFKGRNEDLREIGEVLGVATILEGSIKIWNDRLRINAQLIKASDGTHLWSKTFERSARDLSLVQDEIANAVVDALKITLSNDLSTQTAVPQNVSAYNLFLQGLYFYERTGRGDAEKAADYFERSISIDSTFALAWCYLSLSKWRINLSASDPDWQVIKFATQKALSLTPDLPDAHANLAVFAMADYDLSTAEEEAEKALLNGQRNPRALRTAGLVFSILGRFNESIALFKKSISIDPIQPRPYAYLGSAYYFSGQIMEADSSFQKLRELSPDYRTAWGVMDKVFCSIAKDDSQVVISKINAEPSEKVSLAGMSLIQFVLGKRAESDKLMSTFKEKYADVNAYEIAQVHSYRNENEESLKWLQRAYTQKESGLTYLKVHPVFKNLRDSPGYKQLVEKLNFPD